MCLEGLYKDAFNGISVFCLLVCMCFVVVVIFQGFFFVFLIDVFL